MTPFSDFEELRDYLTHTPGNPVIWDRFLSNLAQNCACDNSYILATNLNQKEQPSFLFSYQLTSEQKSLYTNCNYKNDSFNLFLSKHPYQVFSNRPSLAEQKQQDLTKPHLQYRIGFAIPCNTHYTFNLCVARQQSFSLTEEHLIHDLLKALVGPFKTAIQVDLEQKLYSQALQHTHEHFDSYAVVDTAFNILFSDSIYTAAIDNVDCLHVKTNQIIFDNVEIHHRLSFLMAKSETAYIRNHCDNWQITLIPVITLDNLYAWECFNDGYILAFTEDMTKSPVLDRLVTIHKLSKSEAFCALDFMQIPSISEIAINSSRSESTIRNHIKHIMQKMKVHNQAALMKKLISLSSL